MEWRIGKAPNAKLQVPEKSQRDFDPKPRHLRHELPWEIVRLRQNPNGVASPERTIKPFGNISKYACTLSRILCGYLCTKTQESTTSRLLGDFTYFPGLFVSAISIKKPLRCVPTRIEIWGGLPGQMPSTFPRAAIEEQWLLSANPHSCRLVFIRGFLLYRFGGRPHIFFTNL